jgi:hypothetical protein
VALSVSVSEPRPLAGTLPCGDRTFLPRFQERLPAQQLHSIIVALQSIKCTVKHATLGTNPAKFLQIMKNSGVF